MSGKTQSQTLRLEQLRNNWFVFSLTLLVAFCSIVYELVFSQALTVIFGGTVIRYSMTIGLYLFSLGIGAFLYNWILKRRKKALDVPRLFFYVEIALSILGPLGLIFIVFLGTILTGSLTLVTDVTNKSSPIIFYYFILTISHAPVIIVGILSGLEIPLLSALVKGGGDSFSDVLGFDYIGALFGTIVYAMILYPGFGLVITAIAIGAFNLLAALTFVLVSYRPKEKLPMILSGVLFVIYAFFMIQGGLVRDTLQNMYLRSFVTGATSDSIKGALTTKYQEVVLYDVHHPISDKAVDTCLNLDRHLQLCDSWAHSYHSGLIDLPFSLIENPEEARVLVIGGGDWIAVNYIRKYGAFVDLVDIDEEFITFTKTLPLAAKYHEDAYKYEKLTLHISDAFYYMKTNQKKYDLIVYDLPGLLHDKLLHLYSFEFYSFLNHGLKDNGLLVTWGYPEVRENENHYKGLLNTISAAGFEYYHRYFFDIKTGYGSMMYGYPMSRGNFYYLFRKTSHTSLTEEILSGRDGSTDIRRFEFAGRRGYWQRLPEYAGHKINSVFSPNLDLMISFYM